MIQGVHSWRAVVLPSPINAKSSPDKLSVPVRPLDAIYATFKHLRGVPAHEGGVPFFKLHVLDNLIDRLLSYKQQIPEVESLRAPDLAKADKLIGSLEGRLREAVIASRPLFGGAYPETGMLVDLAA